MKKLVILVLVLVAIFAIAPNFIGQKAETEIRAMYSQMSSPDVSVTVADYQRGWFGATAKVVMTLEIPDMDASEKMELVIHHDLQHGPMLTQALGTGLGLVDIGSRLEFPAFMKTEFPTIDETVNDALDLQARMGFDGSVDGVYKLNEFQFSDEDAQVTVKPAVLNALVTKDGYMKGDGQWDGMSVSDNQTFGITMGSMTTDFDMQALGGNLNQLGAMYLGTSNFTMSEVRISGKEIPGNVEISGIIMQSESKVDNDLMTIRFDTGADEINLIGQTYTNMVFNQTIENLDINVLQQINDLVEQNPQLPPEVMEQLNVLGKEALAKKPVWKIQQLGVSTPQGPISSEMTIRLNEEAVDLVNPYTLPTAIIMDASGYIPEAFVNAMGVGPMVQPFIEQGMLQRDGENLVFELKYERGQVSLFGKPMPL